MLVTQQHALNKARESTFYLGHDSIVDRMTWIAAVDDRLELAIATQPEGSPPDPSAPPAVFSGIFQVMPTMFYLEPDMGIDPNSPAQWQVDMGLEAAFAEGRGSCMLAPVPVTYPDFNAEYSRYIANIELVLKKALPRCTQSGFRVRDNDGKTSLKLTHRLYEHRAPCMIDLARQDQNAQTGKRRAVDEHEDEEPASDTEGITHIDDLDKDVLPEFRICNLPVSEDCKPMLQRIITTHKFNPLHLFKHGSSHPLRPAQYGPKLRGAIVEAHFTLSHRIIKKRKIGMTSHFTATINEITILGMPAEVSFAPSKQRNRILFGIGNQATNSVDSEQDSSGAGTVSRSGASTVSSSGSGSKAGSSATPRKRSRK